MKTWRIILFLGLVYGGEQILYGQSIERYDILISEIMADPTPTIGLPAAEYLELHSRRQEPCTLQNWSLTIGNTRKSLPDIILDSTGYAVLIAAKYAEEFAEICDNLYTLSSLSLADAGQTLVLYNEREEVIHAVSYRQKWHSESIKREGGWSLELQDETLPCIGEGNWDSSTAWEGGTPGAPNAIATHLGDYTRPTLQRVTLLNDSTLRIIFSESIHVLVEEADSPITLEPAIALSEWREVSPFFQALDLYLTEPLQTQLSYQMCVPSTVADCAGNEILHSCLPVGIASEPTRSDLIINEILTYPFDGEDADYIEIYNRSNKIIDLKEVKIGYGGDTLPNKTVCAVSGGRQLPPQQYCVLCKDVNHTQEHYLCQDPIALQACDSLPSLAKSSGIIYLSTINLQTIDRLAYDESMHYSGLTSIEGVSLERIHIDEPTQDASNWHSAASTAGFGTPGFVNSQSGVELPRDQISIYPEVFSPDNDGFDDYTEIVLAFTELENRLTITLYNREGTRIRRLANNVPCGKEALYRWDGQDDNGQIVPSGSYIAVIQWWNASQKNRRIRKVIGVVRR